MTTTAIDQSFLSLQQTIIGQHLGHIKGFLNQLPGLQNSILAIGNAAITVKDALPHGQFMKWVDAHFPGAHSEISACMRYTVQFAEGKFGSLPSIQDINAVKLLTSAKTSDNIREKVARGEIPPTEKAIKEARGAEKPSQTPADVFASVFLSFLNAYPDKASRVNSLLDAIERAENLHQATNALRILADVIKEAVYLLEEAGY